MRDSVDVLVIRQSDGEQVLLGRVRLVDGRIVADGPDGFVEAMKRPHGDLGRGPLVMPDAGEPFLAAVVAQYHSGYTMAVWSDEREAS